MTFDFCFAEAEEPVQALAALAAERYNKKQLALFFAAPADAMTEARAQYGELFASVRSVTPAEEATVYARWNAAAASGYGEWIVLGHTKLTLNAGVCRMLEQETAAHPDTAAFELRQFPRETPRLYQPVTMEPVCMNACCMVVRRSAWKKLGGFDLSVPVSAIEADFTWRLYTAGCHARYLPRAIATWSELPAPQEWPLEERFPANLYLRLKFGTDADVAAWQNEFDAMTRNVSTTPEQERALMAALGRLEKQSKALREAYHATRENKAQPVLFQGTEPVFLRSGATYENVLPKVQPRFSVIVRTRGRAAVLRKTLECLRHQTYRDFEVIVVEDGPAPEAREVAQEAAQWLELTYLALQADCGRCVAGNRGIEAAQGEYLCFLDDDDYFFAEHFEVMAYQIELHPECRLFFAGAVAGVCAGETDTPEPCFVHFWNKAHRTLTLWEVLQDNPAAIQAVVFHKSLYQECGGLDKTLDALEDWDLWARYALHTSFVCVEKATSLYRVPDERTPAGKRRAEHFAQYREQMEERLTRYREKAERPLALAKPQEPCEPVELRKAARSICASRKWRLLGLPVRAAAGILRLFAFGTESRQRAADVLAPKAPHIDQAEAGTLNRFIFLARTSVCWNWMEKKRE